MSKISLTCEFCKRTFERAKSNYKGGKAFCNKNCIKAYRETLKEARTCKQCGKEFKVLKCTMEKSNSSGNYCCRKCYNEYQKTLVGEKNKDYKRITVKCPVCGKELKKTPSRLKIYKNAFCSVKCRGEYQFNYTGGDKNVNWRGGHSTYRGDFESVKRKHFGGNQFCAICGTTNDINIHHIIPYRLSQDNEVDNLIPLCRSHHKIVESASLPFIESFEKDKLGEAKEYMNVLLRPRQYMTAYKIWRVQNGFENRISGH